MAENNKPLTAEEAREKACAASAQDKRLFYTDVKSYMLGFYAGYDHVFNQTAALREELEEVKSELQYKSENLTEALRQIEHYENRLEAVKQEKDEAAENRNSSLGYLKICQEELIRVTSERDKFKVMAETLQAERWPLIDELEAVKKELQGMKDDYHDIDEDGNHIGYGYWKDEYFRMQESARKYLKQRDEVTRQRDEAVKELEYARIIMPFHTGPEYKKWHEEFDKTISRLSSGETKQVETYQIYHYLDFENPPNPEENVLWYRVGEPPYSGSMLDTDFPGLDYFYAWTLIPAPPETSK